MQSLGMKKHTMNWRKLPGRTWFIKYSGVQNILFLRCTECVAIGECGLDFNRNFSPPDVQIEVFEKQVVNFTSIVAYILLSVRWRLHVNLENPCSFMKETHIKKWCPFLKDLWISRKKDKKMQNLLKSFFSDYHPVSSIVSPGIGSRQSSTFNWDVISDWLDICGKTSQKMGFEEFLKKESSLLTNSLLKQMHHSCTQIHEHLSYPNISKIV